ncbi:hypothetical protein PG988_006241 [Apiospora saccharicola]
MPMRDNAAVEQTTSRPAKRRKTEVACQECRDKKTKCDGQRPTCGPCKRKRRPSATCVYPGTRRQSSVEMAELHLLRSEVQDLRQILRQTPQVPAVRPNGGVPGGSSSAATANRIQSSIIAMPVTPSPVLPPPALSGSWNATPGPGGFMGASETTPDEPGPTVFLGPSNAAQFMREVQDASAKERRHSNYRGHEAAIASSSSASASSFVAQRKAMGLLLEFLDSQVLPAPKTADSRLEKYWTYVQPLHPFLHRPTFMEM